MQSLCRNFSTARSMHYRVFFKLFLNAIAIPTVLFGVGGSGRILSRMGWRPFLIAKVSVNSGRTDKE